MKTQYMNLLILTSFFPSILVTANLQHHFFFEFLILLVKKILDKGLPNSLGNQKSSPWHNGLELTNSLQVHYDGGMVSW
jgi:hypothetical protein